ASAFRPPATGCRAARETSPSTGRPARRRQTVRGRAGRRASCANDIAKSVTAVCGRNTGAPLFRIAAQQCVGTALAVRVDGVTDSVRRVTLLIGSLALVAAPAAAQAQDPDSRPPTAIEQTLAEHVCGAMPSSSTGDVHEPCVHAQHRAL